MMTKAVASTDIKLTFSDGSPGSMSEFAAQSF